MTRSEARAAGLRHYDEGRRPCPKGHFPTKRLVSTGGCVACQREHAANARALRPEAQRQAKEAYRAKHPDRVLQHARETYERRKAAANERHKEWLAKNPHKRREHEAARRAKASKADRYTAADVDRLLTLQKHACAYCSKSLRRKFHVDHIVPLSRGGSNAATNIQLLCQPCNQRKFTRSHLDFARSLGLLL